MSAQQIEWIFSLAVIVLGVSHLVRAENWARAFAKLFESEHAAIIIALYSLPVGLILALGSRGFVWDVGLIVTLYGWALIIKSAVYLWLPQTLHAVAKRGGLTVRRSRLAGVMLIVVGLVVGAAGQWPAAMGR